MVTSSRTKKEKQPIKKPASRTKKAPAKKYTEAEREAIFQKSEEKRKKLERANARKRKKCIPYLNNLGQVVVHITGFEIDGFELIKPIRYAFRVLSKIKTLHALTPVILGEAIWEDVEKIKTEMRNHCEFVVVEDLYEKYRIPKDDD